MANSIISVQFHGQNLFVVDHLGEPYTPMKQIVEGMGLAWQAQLAKLNANPARWGITKIVIPSIDKANSLVCLPLRKLFGWLATISPNKVRADLKDRVRQYQNECDDVLYQHWAKKSEKSSTSTDERTGLRNAVNLLVSKKGLMYPDAYSLIHHRFNVEHLDELTKDQLPQAVEYIHRLALEGEYLPAAKVPELSVKPQFTDEELNHLAWLWRVSDVMIKGIKDIYPLLAVAEHKLAPAFLSWKREYPYTLKRAQRHLMRETLHIPVIKGGDPVLLHLRELREIN